MAAEEGYSIGRVFLQVVPSFKNVQNEARRHADDYAKGFENEIDRRDLVGGATRDRSGSARKSGATAGDEYGGAFQRTVTSKIERALRALPKVKIDADSTAAEREIANLRARLETIRDAHINMDVDSGSVIAELDRVHRDLERLQRDHTDISIRSDAAATAAELVALLALIKGIDEQDIDIDIDEHGSLGRVGGAADQTGASFRAFNGILLAVSTVGAGLIPIIAALTGGILALGPALLAAAAGGGVLYLAFSGIAKAVQALSAQQKTAGQDALTASRGQRSAANGIRNASQAVDRARIAAARNAQDSARRIARAEREVGDARQRVADTTEQASEQIQKALADEAEATRELAKAQQDERDAQVSLNRAKGDALKDQQDLNFAVEEGLLSQRQNTLDLADAKAELDAAKASGDSDAITRATIRYEEQTLAIQEQTVENGRLLAAKREADAAGMDGAPAVVRAQEQLTEAVQATKDAQVAVQAAVRDARKAQIDAARDVAKAQRDLNDAIVDERLAREDAAQSAADSAYAIQQAQQSLADAQQGAAEAAQATSAATRNVTDAFSKLGPEGQAFATFIFETLLPGLKELRALAEAGVLPGVMEMLQSFAPFFGPFKVFIESMATTLGNIFRQIGKALISPTWVTFFETMGKYAPIFTQQFASIMLNIATALAGMMTALAPFTKEIGDALVRITKSFADWAAGAGKPGGFQDFLNYVRDNGPKVKDFFVSAVKAFVAIGKALAPLGSAILSALTGLFNGISNMNPEVLRLLTYLLIALLASFQIAVGVAALATAVGTLGAAIAVLTGAAEFSIAAIGGLVGIFVFAAAVLGIGLYLLWKHSETFRTIVTAVWDAVKWGFSAMVDGIKWAWEHVLKPVFEALVKVISLWWNYYAKPILKAFEFGFKVLAFALNLIYQAVIRPLFIIFIDIIQLWWRFYAQPIFKAFSIAFEAVGKAVQWVWDKFLHPVFKLFGQIFESEIQPAFEKGIEAIKSLWESLKDIVKAPIKFIVETVINKALIGTFNSLARKLHVTEIPEVKLPASFYGDSVASNTSARNQTLADGGSVNGFSPHPRADNILARLTAGEFVQPVETVRYYGHEFMEAIRTRRLPRFASGGLIPGFGVGGAIGNALTGGAYGAIMDKVKGFLGQIPGGAIGQLFGGAPLRLAEAAMKFLASLPGKLLGGLKDKVTSTVGGVFSHVNPFADGGPVKLYDNGGILPPGRSSILNLTGANEHAAVLTPQQLAAVNGSGVGQGPFRIVGELDLGDGIVGVVNGVIDTRDRVDVQRKRAS